MVRADPAAAPGLVESTPATLAEMRGRQMKGWLRLDAADVSTDDQLSPWIDYAATLPPKA